MLYLILSALIYHISETLRILSIFLKGWVKGWPGVQIFSGNTWWNYSSNSFRECMVNIFFIYLIFIKNSKTTNNFHMLRIFLARSLKIGSFSVSSRFDPVLSSITFSINPFRVCACSVYFSLIYFPFSLSYKSLLVWSAVFLPINLS